MNKSVTGAPYTISYSLSTWAWVTIIRYYVGGTQPAASIHFGPFVQGPVTHTTV